MQFPTSLQPDRLMTHMRALCQGIGPRPPASIQERQAAEYVKLILHGLNVKNTLEQPFKTQNSYGWITIPYTMLGLLVLPLAWLGGRWGKLAAGFTLLGGVYGLRQFFLARPPLFQPLIARHLSQNVIARIPPAGPTTRRAFLIGHLDTNKQRFLAPQNQPGLTKPFNTLSLLLSALGGISFLVDALRGQRKVTGWQWLIGGIAGFGLVQSWRDEQQPHIEGANDNASAVSVLLGIAAALQEQPLQHIEVTLLFTGCEEVVCVGLENYLQTFAPSRDDSYWIDLEMVGTADLCYVLQHGVSHLSHYTPAPEMVALAQAAAAKHPELRVTGRPMLILEEVANLRYHGYKAICIAGYNEKGYLPNWHRVTDHLGNIEPETLGRAGRYTWALLQEIDNQTAGR